MKHSALCSLAGCMDNLQAVLKGLRARRASSREKNTELDRV